MDLLEIPAQQAGSDTPSVVWTPHTHPQLSSRRLLCFLLCPFYFLKIFFIYLKKFFLFIYSHVHTLFGSFLHPVPLPHSSPPQFQAGPILPL
jgi:hypothetical protein